MTDKLSQECKKAVLDGLASGQITTIFPKGPVEKTLAAIGIIQPQAHGLNQVLEPLAANGVSCSNLKEAEKFAIKTITEQLRRAEVAEKPMNSYSEYASGVSPARAAKIDRGASL